jgi:hypothetical protein
MRYFIPWICSAMMVATAVLADDTPAADTRQQLRELYFDAARTGSTDRLGAFIEAHYDLDTRDESGYTALILAAYHGQKAAVEQLLAAGANPCSQDKRGNTALMALSSRVKSALLTGCSLLIVRPMNAITQDRRRRCMRRCFSARRFLMRWRRRGRIWMLGMIGGMMLGHLGKGGLVQRPCVESLAAMM